MTDKQTDLTSQLPQVPPLRHDPGDRMKIPSDMFYIFYLQKKIPLRPIHVSNSHTKFGWMSSNGLGGDS